MSHKHNPARACIEHTHHLPGKCKRNDGIGTKAPTNFSGGGPSPYIRQDYEVKQVVATDANPVRGHDQMAMGGKTERPHFRGAK